MCKIMHIKVSRWRSFILILLHLDWPKECIYKCRTLQKGKVKHTIRGERPMKKFTFAVFMIALILAAGSRKAVADTFSFSFSGPSDSGYGTVVADPTGTPGQYTIVGGSGYMDGLAMVTLLPAGTYPSTLPSND